MPVPFSLQLYIDSVPHWQTSRSIGELRRDGLMQTLFALIYYTGLSAFLAARTRVNHILVTWPPEFRAANASHACSAVLIIGHWQTSKEDTRYQNIISRAVLQFCSFTQRSLRGNEKTAG
jgi:hypothetical protein